MKKIGVMNCGVRKWETVKPIKAKDIYKGHYFNKVWDYLDKVVEPDEIWIMTTHIPSYTFIPRITKELRYKNCTDNIKVMIHPEEYIMDYETGNHNRWNEEFFSEVLQDGIRRWIVDEKINPQNVEIISLVNKKYYELGLKPIFPHITQPLENIPNIGQRLEFLTQEMINKYETIYTGGR